MTTGSSVKAHKAPARPHSPALLQGHPSPPARGLPGTAPSHMGAWWWGRGTGAGLAGVEGWDLQGSHVAPEEMSLQRQPHPAPTGWVYDLGWIYTSPPMLLPAQMAGEVH